MERLKPDQFIRLTIRLSDGAVMESKLLPGIETLPEQDGSFGQAIAAQPQHERIGDS